MTEHSENHPARSCPSISVVPQVGALVILAVCTWHFLHHAWSPFLWVGMLTLGTLLFYRKGTASASGLPPFLLPLLLVTGLGAFMRLYRIESLPAGPYIDEILTHLHSMDLHFRAIDLFAHTPLHSIGGVETSNLYLCFNWLILKVAGNSYLGMKLFSVVPGIVAAAAFYMTCRRLLRPDVALWAGLLFAAAHWPVRLSRYGWDASFVVMTLAVSIWLLVKGFQEGRSVWLWLAGIASGIGLYGYIAARLCLFSLLVFLLLELVIYRDRIRLDRLGAFLFGAVLTTLPLIHYTGYLLHSGSHYILWLATSFVFHTSGHAFGNYALDK